MKIGLYLIGCLSAIGICLGWLFILLHWPGGSQLFSFSFVGFTVIFIPSILLKRTKRSFVTSSGKIRYITGMVSTLVSGFAVIFKLIRLPGADVLLIVGIGIFSLIFLPFLFFRLYRKN